MNTLRRGIFISGIGEYQLGLLCVFSDVQFDSGITFRLTGETEGIRDIPEEIQFLLSSSIRLYGIKI